MSWQILILINVLLYSISVLLQRTIIKDKQSDPWSFSVFFQLLVGILIWIYTFLSLRTNINLQAPIYHPNIILMTLLWSAANFFIYNALKVTEASVFTVIFSTRVLFTVIVSAIFLGEYVSGKQLFGIVIILAGVLIVSLKKGVFKFQKNDLLSLAAAVCVGLANVNDRVVLGFMDVQTYSVISYLFPAVTMLLLKPSSIKKAREFFNISKIKYTLLLGTLWVGFSLTFNYALKIAPSASQVSAVGLTSVISIVLLSIIFLKERDGVEKKMIGAVLSFIGLLLVS